MLGHAVLLEWGRRDSIVRPRDDDRQQVARVAAAGLCAAVHAGSMAFLEALLPTLAQGR